MIYDSIVVGSGPGGALAATTLASQGKSVLLADRQTFPRDKVCGDGMPLRVRELLKSLEVDTSGLSYHRISELGIVAPSGHGLVTYEKSEDVFSMAAPRLSFDNVLHNHAVKSGAKFEQMDVLGPLMRGDQVVGVIERRGKERIEHEAKVIIAADGATSAIARALTPEGRVAPAAETAIAIRAYARVKTPMGSRVTFFFEDHLLPGYSWIFPVAPDRVNIGIYLLSQDAQKARGESLKSLLDTFIQKMMPDCPLEVEPETIKSWSLPLWKAPTTRVYKGVMLVGDAGRFIDALTGGGIYPAMITGQLAGQHALRHLEGDTTAIPAYDASWRQRIAPELRRADLVQRFIASRRVVFNGIFSIANLNMTFRNMLLNALAGQHS